MKKKVSSNVVLDNDRVYYSKLIGVSFGDRQKIIRSLSSGQKLDLINSNNDIAVYASNRKVGYIDRELSYKLRKQMDAGIKFNCLVKNITLGADSYYEISVEIVRIDTGKVNEGDSIIYCPYCREKGSVNHVGLWICSYCKGEFYYKRDGRVFKKEDALDDGMELIAQIYAIMCKSDGVVSTSEISIIDDLARNFLSLKGPHLKKFSEVFNQSKDNVDNYIVIIQGLYLYYKNKPPILVFIIQSLIAIAEADGVIHPKQQEILRYAINIFSDVTKMKYEDFTQDKSDSSFGHKDFNDYYKVLGCTQNSSDEEIRIAYKNLIKQYHPDKHLSKELPPDMIEYASKRFKEIQTAYEEIKKVRKNL